MMLEDLRVKSGHPDMLVFHRMGDFYEFFYAKADFATCARHLADRVLFGN